MRHNYLIMTAMLLPDPYVVRRFFSPGDSLAASADDPLYAPFRQGIHRKTSSSAGNIVTQNDHCYRLWQQLVMTR